MSYAWQEGVLKEFRIAGRRLRPPAECLRTVRPGCASNQLRDEDDCDRNRYAQAIVGKESARRRSEGREFTMVGTEQAVQIYADRKYSVDQESQQTKSSQISKVEFHKVARCYGSSTLGIWLSIAFRFLEILA
jgi:hypothetical protein